MTISSIYGDSFPEKVLLLDKAIRLANDAPAEAGLANHVQANTQRLARELAGSGASPEASRSLTLLRIFGAQTGQYGTGVDGVIDAPESRAQRSEVATAGLERLAEYILRCPFSLARVVRLTDDGSVIYLAEATASDRLACSRRVPDQRNGRLGQKTALCHTANGPWQLSKAAQRSHPQRSFRKPRCDGPFPPRAATTPVS